MHSIRKIITITRKDMEASNLTDLPKEKGHKEAHMLLKRREKSKEVTRDITVPLELVDAFQARLVKVELAMVGILETLNSWEYKQKEMKEKLEGALQSALNMFIESVMKLVKEFKNTVKSKFYLYISSWRKLKEISICVRLHSQRVC